MMVKLNGCIFLTEDDNFLEKYNAIWYKFSTDINKEVNSDLV